MERFKILTALRNFIIEQNNFDDDTSIEDDSDLLGSGLVDSLMVVSIISFCEEELNCCLDVSELTEENFKSISTLADLITNKLKAENITT